MKIKTLIIISTVIFVFAVIIGVLLFLQSREKIVMRSPMLTQEPSVITYFEGRVEVAFDTDDGWQDAEIGMKLKENSRLKTGSGGLVDLRVYSDGMIRLMENTEVSLADLTIRRQTLDIAGGMIFAKAADAQNPTKTSVSSKFFIVTSEILDKLPLYRNY